MIYNQDRWVYIVLKDMLFLIPRSLTSVEHIMVMKTSAHNLEVLGSKHLNKMQDAVFLSKLNNLPILRAY